MKYFTVERWVDMQNTADERHFRAAHEQWERALNDYRQALEAMRLQLPHRLRVFAERECLHDGVILNSWRRGSSVSILLDVNPPSASLFLLQYSDVDSARMLDSGMPREYRTPDPDWMYDEVAVEPGEAAAEPAGRVFTHSILLSNGWELFIRFRRFAFFRPEAWLPLHNGLTTMSSSALPPPA
jgi:hypothetical protein